MRTVFFDVDTQLDFLFPAGALAFPRAERIVPALGVLTRFAQRSGIQIISTADAHTEDDEEFRIWKAHCVGGTVGQMKAAGSMLGQVLVFRSSGVDVIPTTVLPPQILIEKRSIDCFSNPSLPLLLAALKPDRYVLYGVAIEHCVQKAAVGLLATGAAVELVEDAVCGIDAVETQETLARFVAAGGKMTSVSAVTI